MRPSVKTIDEPIFGRRKRDFDEIVLDENEIDFRSDGPMQADTRVSTV